jgi:subtilisin family serine protease
MIVLIIIAAIAADTKTIVCIVDSGVGKESGVPMCDGKYDEDTWGHGTQVAKTIAAYAGDNYCIRSYKVFYSKEKILPIADAIDKTIGCDVINLSIDSNENFIQDEYTALYKASQDHKIFISAGNAGENLDNRLLFPVGYKLINWTIIGNESKISNHGKIVNQIENRCYKEFCGTSASVAIATGKYVKGLK